MMDNRSLAVRLLEREMQDRIEAIRNEYIPKIGAQEKRDQALCNHDWHSYGWHHNDEYYKCSKCTASKFER